MGPGRAGTGSDRGQLIIDGKGICQIALLIQQGREILRAVVFEVAAFIVDALQEQLIDVSHAGKQVSE